MGRVIHTVHVGHAEVCLDWMLGRSIIEVALMEPVPWRFRFSDYECITTEHLWRLTSGGRLRRTSSDHRHQFGLPAPVDAAGEATALLADLTVSSVHLRPDTGDLQLQFDRGVVLEIITEFTGYEAWQVYGPEGVCYAAHGGSFSTWTQ